MYSAKTIAAYADKYYAKKGFHCSPERLQVTLYFLQGGFIARTGKPCFPDRFQCWDMGPALPGVYFKYKTMRDEGIKDENLLLPDWENSEDQRRADTMLRQLSAYSTTELQAIASHHKPYKKNYIRHQIKVIPQEAMLDFWSLT